MKTLPDDHDPNRLPPWLANASTADLRVVLEFFDCDALRRFYTTLIDLLRRELHDRERAAARAFGDDRQEELFR